MVTMVAAMAMAITIITSTHTSITAITGHTAITRVGGTIGIDTIAPTIIRVTTLGIRAAGIERTPAEYVSGAHERASCS
jgi:uncharacterized membrane protein